MNIRSDRIRRQSDQRMSEGYRQQNGKSEKANQAARARRLGRLISGYAAGKGVIGLYSM